MRVEQIGNATLYLGDCREVLPTLGRVDCVVTDPPYGMEFRSNYRNVLHARIANDDSAALLHWAAQIEASHSRYVFCRWDNLATLPSPRSVIVWIKNNWSMGDLEHEHARQTEMLCFWPGADHSFPNGRPTDVVYAARTGNEHHPTEKPVGLMEKVLQWTEGLVVDPFMGSGSTGVAAARSGRPFVGIEIDPLHYETACRRIEDAYKQADLFVERPKWPGMQQEELRW